MCEQCASIWLDPGELEHARLLHEQIEAIDLITRKRTWGNYFFQFFSRLPVEFNIRPRRYPIVTVTLIVLCTTTFILELILSQKQLHGFIQAFAFNPATFPQAKWFFSLLAHQFIHGSILHLFANMYFLYILGDNVEDVLGTATYVLLYLFSGVFGALAHNIVYAGQTLPIVGASGAIAGVMGSYMVFFRHGRLTFMLLVFQFKLPVFWYLFIWITLQIFALSLAGDTSVAYSAHIGGLAAGLAFSLALYDRILQKRPILKYLAPKRTS